MNIKRQKEFFDEFIQSCQEIMFRKGNDYATADRLSNFKLAGSICGLDAQRNCLSLIATKVARLGVLLQPTSNIPENEAIEDSLKDLVNYAILLAMIEEDTKKGVAAKSVVTTKPRSVEPELVSGGEQLRYFGDLLAQGNNPDKLTNNQVGVVAGWRLIEADEVGGQQYFTATQINNLEWWNGVEWEDCTLLINIMINSYRTKLSKEEFAAL